MYFFELTTQHILIEIVQNVFLKRISDKTSEIMFTSWNTIRALSLKKTSLKNTISPESQLPGQIRDTETLSVPDTTIKIKNAKNRSLFVRNFFGSHGKSYIKETIISGFQSYWGEDAFVLLQRLKKSDWKIFSTESKEQTTKAKTSHKCPWRQTHIVFVRWKLQRRKKQSMISLPLNS